VATGRTVLLASHQISEVERVADTVAILHQGRLCITDSLSRLRETVSAVTVSFQDPLAELPQPAEPTQVLSEQVEGRQRRMIVRDMTDEVLKFWRTRPGVSNVQTRSATLDELFACCVRGRAGRGRVPAAGNSEVSVA
jgi:ABC-2 type transport system ATP-binding protein